VGETLSARLYPGQLLADRNGVARHGMARDSLKFIIIYMELTMSLDVTEELESIWSFLPEDVGGLSEEEAIAQIAEMAVESEEAKYGDILGTDRDAVIESIIRGLNEVHAMHDAEDPRIRLHRLMNA